MIWQSISLMTVIDILILGIVGYVASQFFAGRWQLRRSSEIGFIAIVGGLSLIALFYLADLLVMHAFRTFMLKAEAMAIMRELHMSGNWLVVPLGVATICLGFASVNRATAALVGDLEMRERDIDRELTERKQAEEKITASLAEKEVLIGEIHHRVKNNLQVISSILSLQASTETDHRSRDALEDCQRRIKVMARIHENLHRSSDLTSINARDYLSTVVEDTIASSGHDARRFSCRLDVGDIKLDVDRAVACGQVTSELLSNSVKHAFPNGQSGNIEVSLHRRDGVGEVELNVADDGKGLPEDFDPKQAGTLGMKLVHALAMQLSGLVNIDGSGGTRVRITFPEKPS